MFSFRKIVIDECIKKYGTPDYVAFAPGRANIIGEHTDYSGGYVLPFATSSGLFFAARKRKDLVFEITSLNSPESATFEVHSGNNQTPDNFARYIFQVLSQLPLEKISCGISMVINGNLPLGAGMSSSSALTCGVLAICNELYHLQLTRHQMVQLAVKAEHGTGVIGGLMDQYTIFFGEKNKALMLDCQTMNHYDIDIDIEPYGFFLINSMVKHDLIDSPYNKRRSQSEEALKAIRDFENNQSLMYKDLNSTEKYRGLLKGDLLKRAKHIITENHRVLEMVNALEKKDINLCGRILMDSHQSLQLNYEVSCHELDYLFDICSGIDDWRGGRMMGGGFGGCTINIFLKKNINSIFEKISSEYYKKFRLIPELYSVSPSGGLYTESFIL